MQNGSSVFEVVTQGEVVWDTARSGQPGKLTYSVIPDPVLHVTEGNAVRLDVDGSPVFFGFLFQQTRGKDGVIQMVAYDQLRYLKNKDSYNYENLTATELIQKIAGDFDLRLGTLEDTVYKIPERNEGNKTLFDIIINALNATMMNSKEIFVLYDDAGALTLKNIDNMKLSVLIGEETAEDYDYKSSIDGETYNQIKLSYKNNETAREDTYVKKDPETIKQWGVLQYYGELQQGEDGRQAAEVYLSLYNKQTKSLSIKNAFGDVNVRGGCLLPVILDLGDTKLKNYMLVENVKHTFDGGHHSMDLSLKGYGFYG